VLVVDLGPDGRLGPREELVAHESEGELSGARHQSQCRVDVPFGQTELVSLASRRGELEVALRLARDVIDTWHRAGDWANQWLTLRHVAGVLTQRGDYEDAALLQGAVRVASAEMAMPIEASDLLRVGEILEQLPAALGPERLADAESRASAMLDDVVVRHTLATIARILPDG
jgi:hypothetical protein